MQAGFDIATIQRGARLRRSPFFDATMRAGCRGYTVYNHMFLPIQYDDLEQEYSKLLSDVTVWDVSVERQVEITGPDAFALTNLLTPRDLTKCRVGQGKYVAITAEDGGIINDPVLLRLGENHFWLALADSDVLLWARGVAYNSGLDVEIREPDVSPLQIQGPKSKPVVQALFGDRVLDYSATACSNCPTTTSWRRNWKAYRSWSPVRDGAEKSGTRSISATGAAGTSCGSG
jgi:aminomethyltransferase